MYNTRIAPSPSGYFHLGTARTAYFNWLAARATGGKFILRIDDTNQALSNDAYVKVIDQAMQYLDLDFDIRFSQSTRGTQYAQVIDDLLTRGKAVKRDGAVYLNHALQTTVVKDLALGAITANSKDLDHISNLVLVRSDGIATYHFASVVDDIDHDINLVIRGSDHINNTMKQVAIYDALQAQVPLYSHVGLLCDMNTGKKLSKSDGAPSLLTYQDSQVNADAMCNFLLRLGWGPKVDDKSTTTISKARALALFLDGGNMRSASSRVDFSRLAALHRKYQGK